MKSNNALTLLALTVISLSVVINTAGRPTVKSVSVKPSPALAGIDQTQGGTVMFNQKMQANTTLEAMMEPRLILGSSTRVTGLYVDCLQPQQTWNMLTASAVTRVQPESIPPYLLLVTAPHPFNNDLAVHEPDFAVLRLSLP
jgi:hypothetical protein